MLDISLTERMIDFSRNPFGFVPIGHAQTLIADSKLTTINGPRYQMYTPEKSLKEMSIESMLDKEHYVLYSGGKESMLTCKILDFYGINFKKVVIRESVKNIPKEVIDEADVVISSEMIETYANDHLGAHIPLIGYYIGLIGELYPNSVIWVGAAHVNEFARFMMGNSDHSDYTFNAIHKEHNIEVYSCVNSLSEFDIYRICKKYYGYSLESSVMDCPNKSDRMLAFELISEGIDVMSNIPKAERNLMFDWNVIELEHFKIEIPTIFDFRSDVSLFLASIEELHE